MRKCAALVSESGDKHSSIICGKRASVAEVWESKKVSVVVWLCSEHHQESNRINWAADVWKRGERKNATLPT